MDFSVGSSFGIDDIHLVSPLSCNASLDLSFDSADIDGADEYYGDDEGDEHDGADEHAADVHDGARMMPFGGAEKDHMQDVSSM